jgi:hypothetical protein
VIDGWGAGSVNLKIYQPLRKNMKLELKNQATKTTSSTKKTSTPKVEDKASGQIQTSGQNSLAVYSGRMDVAVVSPDNITIAGLLDDKSLQVSDGEAAKKLIRLEQTRNGLLIQRKELAVVREKINVHREEQRVAEAAYKYSEQVSNTKNYKHRAEIAEVKLGLETEIRNNEVTILQGKKAVTDNKAARARSIIEAYSAIDVEFS